MQFAQIAGAGQRGYIARPQVEHPLRGVDGRFVISQFDVGVDQVAIDGYVVGRFLIEPSGGFESLGELMPAELQPGLGFEGLIIAGRESEGLPQRFFSLGVVRDVGRFARAASVGHGKRVVVRRVIRVLSNRGLSLFDRHLGR